MRQFEIRNYKVMRQGNIKAQFEVYFPEAKMLIKNCKHGCGVEGQEYILWPALSYEKDGRKKFFSLIEFEKEEDKKIKEEILNMLRKY